MKEFDFEISRRVLNVKFDGMIYKVLFPDVGQSKKLAEKIESDKKTPFIDILREFLNELGLPLEVSAKMELFDIEFIAKKFQDEKKY